MTIENWLKQLQEPYRSEALYNRKHHHESWGYKEAISLSEALEIGFEWINTKQGHDYWKELKENIQHMKENGTLDEWLNKSKYIWI